MVQKLDYLKETPSQTAGPYVHIGLAPGAAGFSIFERNWAGTSPGRTLRVNAFALKGW